MNQTTHDPPAPTEHRYVSTAQVSQALGVSVTTVKRWVDDGVLPAHKTAGGHRKLLLADILRLVRDGNLPRADLSRLVPQPAATDGADLSGLSAEMTEAVRTADADRIRTILHGAYRAGVGLDRIADRVVAPAMRHVGDEWLAGRTDVMTEHRVTQAMVSSLYELKSQIRGNVAPGRPVAVGGAPEHDHYVLPSLVAKLTLLDGGWDAVNLGPHTPFSAFRDALERFAPRLIWVSVTHLHESERFVNEYGDFVRDAERRGVAVAVGGQALTDALRARLSYATFGDGMVPLAAFANTLYRRPAVPKRGRPHGSMNRTEDPVLSRT